MELRNEIFLYGDLFANQVAQEALQHFQLQTIWIRVLAMEPPVGNEDGEHLWTP